MYVAPPSGTLQWRWQERDQGSMEWTWRIASRRNSSQSGF
ncbi:hypothetical protein X971_4728 [Agrobacterium tumefaciens LBA4213 (Ach5)]|nr:hypothetical protein X971_4728 [Agrobacterium tumefaciens LBA4213 (Ach5)]